jgi:hypothetical protein
VRVTIQSHILWPDGPRRLLASVALVGMAIGVYALVPTSRLSPQLCAAAMFIFFMGGVWLFKKTQVGKTILVALGAGVLVVPLALAVLKRAGGWPVGTDLVCLLALIMIAERRRGAFRQRAASSSRISLAAVVQQTLTEGEIDRAISIADDYRKSGSANERRMGALMGAAMREFQVRRRTGESPAQAAEASKQVLRRLAAEALRGNHLRGRASAFLSSAIAAVGVFYVVIHALRRFLVRPLPTVEVVTTMASALLVLAILVTLAAIPISRYIDEKRAEDMRQSMAEAVVERLQDIEKKR